MVRSQAFRAPAQKQSNVSSQAAIVKQVFRGLSRLFGSYTLSLGPVRAQGVPAVLIAASGVIIAGGIATALARSANRLPETLNAASGLAHSLRGGDTPARLTPHRPA